MCTKLRVLIISIVMIVLLSFSIFSISALGKSNYHEDGFIVLEYTDKDVLAFELEQFAEGYELKDVQYNIYIVDDVVYYTALVHYKDLENVGG